MHEQLQQGPTSCARAVTGLQGCPHCHTQGVSERLWVARLHISERTAQKITSVHHITPQEVRDAVELQAGLIYAWNEHPKRGRRALVEVFIRGRRTIVVLYIRSSARHWATSTTLERQPRTVLVLILRARQDEHRDGTRVL